MSPGSGLRVYMVVGHDNGTDSSFMRREGSFVIVNNAIGQAASESIWSVIYYRKGTYLSSMALNHLAMHKTPPKSELSLRILQYPRTFCPIVWPFFQLNSQACQPKWHFS